MKSVLLSLLYCISLFPGIISAQKNTITADLERLKSCTWTDGFEFVKYHTPEAAKEVWNLTVEDKNTLAFIGGTLHEGGTCFFLSHDDESMWVDRREEYQLFPVGDKLSFDSNKEIVMFRDASSGALHGILKPFEGKDPLQEMRNITIGNMRRLGLAGTYKDKAGKRYVFSPNKNLVTGLPVSYPEYTFAVILDFPSPILIFSDKKYSVTKTREGLELIEVQLYNDEEDFYEPVPNSKLLSLTRVINPMECDYPLLSREFFTLTELVTYAGDPYKTVGPTDRTERLKQLIETLSTMRNEIFARHGYIFKSSKWKEYFSRKQWYRPTQKDVTSELSEIEKVNIELLQLQENRFKKELKEMKSM